MDDQNQNPQQALTSKIKDSKNILVTVSTNPSVDQLAACVGLTLWLNKIDKHATAVFSGDVPSTLEFLQPEETLEKNTDSLRDFIISLDKSKADKLRYKVEDAVVKVFVTPYRTSLSADDLEFSQGDFNVDMVIALGVHEQSELDAAVVAHGRILHDATVVTVTTGEQSSELGAINWHDGQASSLCELVTEIANDADKSQLDNQIATALLTGVIAETERFSNEKTTPQTMSISAQLMSAGANQQLVASKLAEPVVEADPTADSDADEPADQPNTDGEVAIEHDPEAEPAAEPEQDTPAEPAIDEVKATAPDGDEVAPEINHFATEEPAQGGTLTANATPEDIMNEPTTDPFSQPVDPAADDTMLNHDGVDPMPAADQMQPAPPDWMPAQTWMSPTTVEPVAPEEPIAPEVPVDEPAEDVSLPSPVVDDQTMTMPTPELTPEPAASPSEDVSGALPNEPQDQPADNSQSEPVAEVQPAEEPAAEPAPQPESATPDLDSARDEVLKAIDAAPLANAEPVEALNAQPIDLNPPTDPAPLPPGGSTVFDPNSFAVMNDPETAAMPAAQVVDPNAPVNPDLMGPVDQPFTMPLPGQPLAPPPANPTPPTSVEFDPTAPPPVPPPMMPPKQ